MPATGLYQRIGTMIERYAQGVPAASVQRLSLYVSGVLKGRHGSPAQVAKAVQQLHLGPASAESRERQIRRMENDPAVQASTCFHPLARAHLALGKPQSLLLIIDPTLQEDRLVMVSINVWYRARSLPLVWTLWPANQPLEGARFWERIARLLDALSPLLPHGIPITMVADRAFGTPAFTDRVAAHGWAWIVRVQDQTLYRDQQGHVGPIGQLVHWRNGRKKLRGWAFKKAGWRAASVVVYWGRRHKKPLCLVSSLHPGWLLLHLYRRRFPIEGTFRDYKAYGWHWEQGQVTEIAHMQRLLVGMALACWIAWMTGTWQAQQLLSRPPTGKRHTRPYDAKVSLFHLGLELLQDWFMAPTLPPFQWRLTDWDAPNWSDQLRAHHARAFVFAL